MADIQAHLGIRFDSMQRTLDKIEAQQREARAWMEEESKGVKAIRLPKIQATGTNPFSMGGDTGTGLLQGPDQGYVWSLRHLIIEGMTRTATPDIIQVRRGNAQGDIIWELNGNSYGQTWGRGEIIIFSGETLFYQSVGTFNSTATIKAYGVAEQVPGEKIRIFF